MKKSESLNRMSKFKRSLSIAVFLLGWLATQVTAIHHEFSSEHLNSTNSHICLAQAAHLDELVTGDFESLAVPLNTSLEVSSRDLQVGFEQKGYSAHCPRAPPFQS